MTRAGHVGSMAFLCLAAALSGLVTGCEHNAERTEPANVAGLWTVSGIWPGKSEVEFQQDGKYVTALVAKPNTYLNFSGEMHGDQLEGVFVQTSANQPITIDATVSGDGMRGWWTQSPSNGAFTATRK